MRSLALDYLIQEIGARSIPDDAEEWYSNLRKNEPEKLFPYLVEDSGKLERVYIIEQEDSDSAFLTVMDVIDGKFGEGCTGDKLPFMRPSGPQSAQVGPVFKRSYTGNKGGPSEKILETTMHYFAEVSDAERPWSNYFKEILSVLRCNKLRLLDGAEISWADLGYKNLLSCAVDKIGSQSNTVFLTIRTLDGKLPGEQATYIDYLLKDKLAGERYVTKSSPAAEVQICSLCNNSNVTVYSNGLKGAGLNFSNVDREGAFPNIDAGQAWKGFGICGACADLLYVYKNHVIKKGGPQKDKIPFSSKIAGALALVVPDFLEGISANTRRQVLYDVNDYINVISKNVLTNEEDLLDVLKDEKSILNLVFLWADIGQNIENVRGMISSVLPSRLQELSQFNIEIQEIHHALFPKISLAGTQTDFTPNLSLVALKHLFYRPGGKQAKDVNASQRLFQLKRRIAECVYQSVELNPERFWNEILITARWYWLEAIKEDNGYKRLLYEGNGKNGAYLTAAGWIKHVNWWMYYFKKVGVLEMAVSYYEPAMVELKTYFGPESGIDTPDKGYAFLLGVLYGKVLQVQGAKGVNVGANALTWLKRLTLQGKDLPALYCKIREKNFAYDIEANSKVRELLNELGRLGVQLGDSIKLDDVQTSYYLLLGQSMTDTIVPSKKNKEVRA